MTDYDLRDVMAANGAAPSTAARSRVYCTYFDGNYLPRGLALWRSLRRVSPDAVLWVCCLDQTTRQALARLALPGMHLFSLEELERRFPDLAAVRPTRSRIEYYFTCTPSVIRFVLDVAPEARYVTYLDADLYFFADPEPLFDELASAGGAIAIIGHRFPERLRDREVYGLYNVGWLTFARDERGLACLEEWRRDCVAWCYARLEDGKFADQKYLDAWPANHPGVVVLRHAGANVALWNLDSAAVGGEGGRVTIKGEPLLFYHFHGLQALSGWLFHISLLGYGAHLGAAVRRRIYRPYLREWREALALAATVGVAPGISRGALRHGIVQYLKDQIRRLLGRRRGDYVVIWPSPTTRRRAARPARPRPRRPCRRIPG